MDTINDDDDFPICAFCKFCGIKFNNGRVLLKHIADAHPGLNVKGGQKNKKKIS